MELADTPPATFMARAIYVLLALRCRSLVITLAVEIVAVAVELAGVAVTGDGGYILLCGILQMY